MIIYNKKEIYLVETGVPETYQAEVDLPLIEVDLINMDPGSEILTNICILDMIKPMKLCLGNKDET